MNIFADDLRENIGKYREYKVYRTYEDLLEDIKEDKITKIEILTLDHDMGVDENNRLRMSGSQFVVKLIELMLDMEVEITQIKFHTSNVVGYENMSQTLLGAIKRGFIPHINIDKNITNYLEESKEY